MSTKVNKLYINVDVAGPTGGVSQLLSDAVVVAFPLTRASSATVAADQYGRFLKDYEAMTGADPDNNRAKKKVSAWFQASPAVSAAGALSARVASGYGILLDFIAATGVATSLASIDPTTTRHFRLRAIINRLLTSTEFARNTLNGTIFIQRQHSIEV